jgi:hypothetical protein
MKNFPPQVVASVFQGNLCNDNLINAHKFRYWKSKIDLPNALAQ